MAFERKVWEKTRPLLGVKETGLGKACDAWQGACKSVGEVALDKAHADKAFEAVDAMDEALAEVARQASKLKDAKTKKQILDLHSDWAGEAKKYRASLESACEMAAHAAVVTEFERVVGLAGKLLDEAEKWLEQSAILVKKGGTESVRAMVEDAESKLSGVAGLCVTPQTELAGIVKSLGGRIANVPVSDVADVHQPLQARYLKLKALQKAIRARIDPPAPGK
jgi:hypothetical protein